MSYSLGNAGIPQTQVCKKKKLSELSVNTKPLIVEDAATGKRKKKKENDIAMLTIQDKNSCQK